MRIVTFNILLGGEERYPAILRLLQELQPDVAVLQECLDWDEDRLASTGEHLGLPHTVLAAARPRGSGKRYHVSVLSRLPLREVRVYNDPAVQAHCLVRAELEGRLTLLGTHFDAHDESVRLSEARFLNRLFSPDRAMVLAGDLNSLSRRDPYPRDLEALLKLANTSKYGYPPRFDVLDELERAGWLDALYLDGKPERWVTARRDRGGVRIDYRTDYLLVSPALRPRVLDCRVGRMKRESDHHPVVLDLRKV
ncbi:MAG: endonuclease/exonuclease/phosphatase family protein [Candidatus Eremiobacterota bacterium]